jgi:hypothetical protein
LFFQFKLFYFMNFDQNEELSPSSAIFLKNERASSAYAGFYKGQRPPGPRSTAPGAFKKGGEPTRASRLANFMMKKMSQNDMRQFLQSNLAKFETNSTREIVLSCSLAPSKLRGL